MSLKKLDKSHNEISSKEAYNHPSKSELIKMLEKILEKKNRKTTPIKKVIRERELTYNKKNLVEIVSKTGQKYKVNQKVASKIIEIQTINNNKLLNKPRLKINNKDPIKLMESCGMKKPSIQEAMLKKAEEIGGDNKDSQYLALERLLGINKQEPILKELEKTHGKEKSL